MQGEGQCLTSLNAGYKFTDDEKYDTILFRNNQNRKICAGRCVYVSVYWYIQKDVNRFADNR